MKKSHQQKDPRGGHIRLHWDILDSPAWRALSHADIRVYIAIRRKLGKTTNGDINAVLTELAHAGINSSSTLNTALHRLEALGFISKTRQGGIASGGKLCSLYRFTDECTYDIAKAGVKAGPATNDWKRFTTVAQAKAAVKEFAPKKKELRPSKRKASTIEAEARFCASIVEDEGASPLRLSKRRIAPQNQAETRMDIGFQHASEVDFKKSLSSSTIEHLCIVAIPRVASARMGHDRRYRWLSSNQAGAIAWLAGTNQSFARQAANQ